MESFAQAVAYGLNATKHVDPWVPVGVKTFIEIVRTENDPQLGINVGLLLISIYPTWVVVANLDPPEDKDVKKKTSDEEEDSISQKDGSDLKETQL